MEILVRSCLRQESQLTGLSVTVSDSLSSCKSSSVALGSRLSGFMTGCGAILEKQLKLAEILARDTLFEILGLRYLA